MRVVRVPGEIAAALPRLAEAALPREACALLMGRAEADFLVVDGIAPSRNLADTDDTFELDTALHLRLQRTTRAVIGVWHSHPRGAAIPSARDEAGAWDEQLVWLITAGADTRAWMPCGGGAGFAPLVLEIV